MTTVHLASAVFTATVDDTIVAESDGRVAVLRYDETFLRDALGARRVPVRNPVDDSLVLHVLVPTEEVTMERAEDLSRGAQGHWSNSIHRSAVAHMKFLEFAKTVSSKDAEEAKNMLLGAAVVETPMSGAFLHRLYNMVRRRLVGGDGLPANIPLSFFSSVAGTVNTVLTTFLNTIGRTTKYILIVGLMVGILRLIGEEFIKWRLDDPESLDLNYGDYGDSLGTENVVSDLWNRGFFTTRKTKIKFLKHLTKRLSTWIGSFWKRNEEPPPEELSQTEEEEETPPAVVVSLPPVLTSEQSETDEDVQSIVLPSPAAASSQPDELASSESFWDDEDEDAQSIVFWSKTDEDARPIVLPSPAGPPQEARDRNAPPGLKNYGNTCYFNALISALFHVPQVRTMRPATVLSLQNTFNNERDAYHATRRVLYEPQPLLMTAASHNTTTNATLFKEGYQQDPSEALSSLLDGMSALRDLCRITWKKNITCDGVEEPSTEVEEYMMHLSFENNSHLDVTAVVTQEDREQVTLDRCTTAIMTTRLDRPPQVLVLNLIRNVGRGKIMAAPTFELEMNIRGAPYALCAVVLHSGKTANGGHYVSRVLRGSDWYECNDASVYRVGGPLDTAGENRRQIKMMFYSRRTTEEQKVAAAPEPAEQKVVAAPGPSQPSDVACVPREGCGNGQRQRLENMLPDKCLDFEAKGGNACIFTDQANPDVGYRWESKVGNRPQMFESLSNCRNVLPMEIVQHGRGPAGYAKFEFCRDGSLKRFVESNPRPDVLLSLLRQVEPGLQCIHGRGYLHGDVKPQNMVVCGDTLKYIDIGGGVIPTEVSSNSVLKSHPSPMYTPYAYSKEFRNTTNEELIGMVPGGHDAMLAHEVAPAAPKGPERGAEMKRTKEAVRKKRAEVIPDTVYRAATLLDRRAALVTIVACIAQYYDIKNRAGSNPRLFVNIRRNPIVGFFMLRHYCMHEILDDGLRGLMETTLDRLMQKPEGLYIPLWPSPQDAAVASPDMIAQEYHFMSTATFEKRQQQGLVVPNVWLKPLIEEMDVHEWDADRTEIVLRQIRPMMQRAHEHEYSIRGAMFTVYKNGDDYTFMFTNLMEGVSRDDDESIMWHYIMWVIQFQARRDQGVSDGLQQLWTEGKSVLGNDDEPTSRMHEDPEWWDRHRKMLMVSGIFSALKHHTTTTEEPRGAEVAPRQEAVSGLKCVTYNVFQGDFDERRRTKITEWLKRQNAHVVCVQEEHAKPLMIEDQMERIHICGQGTYEAVAAYVQQSLPYSVTACLESHGRHALLFEIVSGSRTIKIANLHLLGGRYADQQVLTGQFDEQLRKKLSLLEEILKHEPDIVCGDFNSVHAHDEELLEQFLQGQYTYFEHNIVHAKLTDEQRQRVYDWNREPYRYLANHGYTYARPDNPTVLTNGRGRSIVDCVWHRDTVRVANCTIGDTGGGSPSPWPMSDHNPVSFEVFLVEEEPHKV